MDIETLIAVHPFKPFNKTVLNRDEAQRLISESINDTKKIHNRNYEMKSFGSWKKPHRGSLGVEVRSLLTCASFRQKTKLKLSRERRKFYGE